MILGTKLDGFGRMRIALALLAVVVSLGLNTFDYTKGLPAVERLKDAACHESTLEAIEFRRERGMTNYLARERECLNRLAEVDAMVSQKQQMVFGRIMLDFLVIAIGWLVLGIFGWVYRGFQKSEADQV